MTVEPRISQITYLPTWVLSQSIPLDNFNRACMVSPIKGCCEMPGPARLIAWGWARFDDGAILRSTVGGV